MTYFRDAKKIKYSVELKICIFMLYMWLLARFLALVTTMVTKVDHGN